MAWKDNERATEKEPMAFAAKILLALCIFISIIGFGFGWFGESTKTAQKKFEPRAILKK